MKYSILVGFAAGLCLYGCNSPANNTSAGSSPHGRYVGIGIYPAGQMWAQVVVANPPRDAAASKSSDDEQVIVVVDTTTGEIRQCGNYSGYCVSMNPWTKPLTPSQSTPVLVAKHANQLTQPSTSATSPAATPPH